MNERAEPRRYISSLEAKEVQERLSFVESVLNKVPVVEKETSALSSSLHEIYTMSMQLRNDLEAMKNADAVTEVDCNENDGCECECYAKPATKLATKPVTESVPEPAADTESMWYGCVLFITFVGTGLAVAGFVLMFTPLINV